MKKIYILNILLIFAFFSKNVISQTVWAWGNNVNGQLGIGKDISYEIPVLVKNMSNAVSISAGGYHSIALKNNGTVWAWGYNYYGQLGNWECCSLEDHENLPVKVVTEDGEELKDVIKVSAGVTRTLALKSDGTVWIWGSDYYLSCKGWDLVPFATKVEGIENIVDIAAGPVSLTVKADGTVWWWGGLSIEGQVVIESCIPVKVPNLDNVKAVEPSNSLFLPYFALKNDGTLWEFSLWGYTKKIMDGVKQVSTGGGHTLVLKEDGTVWAWGNNHYGQLGNGTNKYSDKPVQVLNLNDIIAVSAGYDHSLALKMDGTVFSWGANYSGQLGNGTDINSNVPVPVLNLKDIVSISASSCYWHNLALDKDGFVWAWGENEYGQIGNGYDKYVKVPERLELNNILSLSCYSRHTLASDKNGEVWAWGNAEYGQLGIGEWKDTDNIPFPVKVAGLENIISVEAGGTHSLALDIEGDVWVWGSNKYGELGLGTDIKYSFYPVKNPYLKDIVKISARWGISYALKKDGTVWVWGGNQNIPVMVSNLTDVVEISCGDAHCLALTRDGTVWAWGNNYHGQLGNGKNGPNEYSGIPIQVPKISNIISIYTGGNTSFAKNKDGKVYGWGCNEYGQLGNGTTNDSNVPIEIDTLQDMDIVLIKGGYYHTLAMDKEGNVWSWGGWSKDSLIPEKVERIKNAIFIEAGESSSFAISQSEHIRPF